MRKRFRVTPASAVLLMYSAGILLILLYISYNSLRVRGDFLRNTLGLPEVLTLQNYVTIFVRDHFITYIYSSVVILVATLMLNTMLASMVAYGIGRFKFRFHRPVLMYFLIGMMFPIQLSVVPLFLIMRDLGLLNTYLSVILVSSASMSLPVLLLNIFFSKLPDDIYESAKLEGASEFRIFLQVMMPLASPVIVSIMIIISLQVWNQFFLPLIFLQSDRIKTLPLAQLMYTVNMMRIDRALAAATVSVVPVITLYFIFSKRVISGVAEGAVKG